MPGEGVEPSRPLKGTPDFKSGAYDQFRHPGRPRIARGRSEAWDPVEASRDLLRRGADNDRVLVVLLERDPGRVAVVELPVHVQAPRGQRLAVAADALVRELDAPDAEELAERVRPLLVSLEVDDAGGPLRRAGEPLRPCRMRVQLRDELSVEDADSRGNGHVLAVHEDVEVHVDVDHVSLGGERSEAERLEPVRQMVEAGVPRRGPDLQADQLALVDRFPGARRPARLPPYGEDDRRDDRDRGDSRGCEGDRDVQRPAVLPRARPPRLCPALGRLDLLRRCWGAALLRHRRAMLAVAFE